MKYSECNARQKKAFKNIKYACDWLIGGLENTLMDFPEDSTEYKSAFETLNNHEGLVNTLYEMCISDVYDEGFVQYNSSYLKDVRFCGKDWLMERCSARLKKEGY